MDVKQGKSSQLEGYLSNPNTTTFPLNGKPSGWMQNHKLIDATVNFRLEEPQLSLNSNR